MDVYVANFGQGNFAWEDCKTRSTVAVFNDIAVHGFWEAGNRDAYVDYSIKHLRTAKGTAPTPGVAARWYNLMSTLQGSSGDFWTHQDGKFLWWTKSTADGMIFEQVTEPVGENRQVVMGHKPCEPWINKASDGTLLAWDSLHPRARNFFSIQSTLSRLSEEPRSYFHALIKGEDLGQWHNQPDWAERLDQSKKSMQKVKSFSGIEKSIYEMVTTAARTAINSNGQIIQKTLKNKDFNFPSEEAAMDYVKDLISMQDGLCAITGIPLRYSDKTDNPSLLASLDRIDSSGHYEPGNLQVVCRFINFWKQASDDSEFRSLIKLVRESAL